jgi:GntR family transcriptional regulator
MSMASSGLQTRPLYLQVRDALAARIAKGDWRPGAAIPNELDLAREYGVSAGTMRKALDVVESERLITRQQGRGTFVNDQSSEELTTRFSAIRDADGQRISGQVELGEVSQGAASELERDRLRLQIMDQVYRVRCTRLYKNRPFMVEEASMPADLFPRLAQINGFPHPIVALAQRNGILVGKAEERISVRVASPEVAEALGILPRSPILVLDRVLLTLDGRPIEWRVGQCNLSTHHYLAELN